MFNLDSIRTRLLIKAAKKGANNILDDLLNEGIDVNTKDKDGMTALMWATHYCNLNTVGFLLDKGADVNVRNESGYTALKLSEESLYPEIAELLKEHGAVE
jgi:ankyrin repeat protein